MQYFVEKYAQNYLKRTNQVFLCHDIKLFYVEKEILRKPWCVDEKMGSKWQAKYLFHCLKCLHFYPIF